MNRGHHSKRSQSAGIDVADRGAGFAAGAALRTRDRGQPAHALRNDVVRGPIRVRARAGARISEAANRGIDQGGIDFAQPLVADSRAIHHAGIRILDERVRGFHQPENRFAAGVALDVEHDAALVAIDAGEISAVVAAFAIGGMRSEASAHVAAGRLDLDNVGAEVRQQHRAIGTGQRLRQIEDANIRQRSGACAHRLAQWERRLISTVRSPSKTIVPSCLVPQCLKRTMPASSRSASRFSRTSL